MNAISTRNWFWIFVFAALVLRLAGIDLQGYWGDEALTNMICCAPWSHLFDLLQHIESNKPPLYFIFMHVWLQAGTSETWGRLPSVLWGALTCGVFFLVVRRLGGQTLALIASGLLVFNSFHLGYSDEARMYSLYGLLACATFYFLVAFLQEQRGFWLAGFFVCSLLASYTFSYGFFLLGLAGLLSLVEWQRIGLRPVLALVGTAAISFLCFVPWLLVMMHSANEPTQAVKNVSLLQTLGYTFFTLGYGFDLGPPLVQLQSQGGRYFSSHHGQALVTLVALAVLALLFVRGVVDLRRNRLALIFCLGGMAICLGGPAIISLLKPLVTYNPRYAFVALFPLLIGVAAGLRVFWKDGVIGRGAVLLYVLFLSWSAGNFYLNPRYHREDMRKISRYAHHLKVLPSSIVITPDNIGPLVSYYFPEIEKIYGLHDFNPAQFNHDATDLAAQVPPGLFLVIYMRPEQGDRDGLLRPWFQSHYRLVEHRSWVGAESFLYDSK